MPVPPFWNDAALRVKPLSCRKWLPFLWGSPLQYHIPVSYTHLDVYKRQRYSYSKRGNFMKPFFFSLSSPRRRYRHSAENPPHMQADGTFQAHPVQGMTYFLRYAYLLLIPFLRQALSSPETLLQQIYSSLSNLLLGALIMLFIYLRWRCTYISATSSCLLYTSRCV